VDGSEWIFERVDEAGYHMVKRWSPREGSAREIGLFLLDLTAWQFDEIY